MRALFAVQKSSLNGSLIRKTKDRTRIFLFASLLVLAGVVLWTGFHPSLGAQVEDVSDLPVISQRNAAAPASMPWPCETLNNCP